MLVVVMCVGLAVAVVFATSLVLHHFPVLPFHTRRKRLAASVLRTGHMSHRGCRLADLPENSLPAFAHALRCNTDLVELDVRETKDGKVVVFHDSELHRMCGGPRGVAVRDVRFADLPRLRVDANPDASAAIPLLDDVLQALPREVGVIVEIKDHSPTLVANTHALLHRHHRTTHGNTVLYSLNPRTNHHIRKHFPHMPTASCALEVLATPLLHLLGLLPFVPLGMDVLLVPVPVRLAPDSPALDHLPPWVRRVVAVVVACVRQFPPAWAIRPSMQHHLHRRGVATCFLMVNDEEALAFARDRHAAAVLTDHPEWLADQLRRRPLPSPHFR